MLDLLLRADDLAAIFYQSLAVLAAVGKRT